MIPGTTSKLSESTLASAATISPKSDVVKVTGTVQINNIVPSFGGGFGGFVILVPTDGAVVLGTSGNVLVGLTAAQNRALMLIYVKTLGKWIIESGV